MAGALPSPLPVPIWYFIQVHVYPVATTNPPQQLSVPQRLQIVKVMQPAIVDTMEKLATEASEATTKAKEQTWTFRSVGTQPTVQDMIESTDTIMHSLQCDTNIKCDIPLPLATTPHPESQHTLLQSLLDRPETQYLKNMQPSHTPDLPDQS